MIYLNMADNWESEGSVIIKGLFNWMLSDASILNKERSLSELIDIKFKIYRHY